ncbi:MAG: NIPSNAP family protein [Bryobacteraceae bacterium]
MLRKYAFVGLMVAAAAGIGFWAGQKTQSVEAASNHVFEFRTYTTEPGKLDTLNTRFRDHTMRIFKKHNMTSVGYFVPQDDPQAKNTLLYILEFPSREAAKKSWDEFRADPEWQKVQKESEANGKIVGNIVSVFAEPTDYSPKK